MGNVMDFEKLQMEVLNWAESKELVHAEYVDKQFLKFIEEIFEFKTEFDILVRYRKYYRDNPQKRIPKAEHNRLTKNVKLEMGDILVTLIILSKQLDLNPEECLQVAYEKIKNRKGKTINGTFIKDEDLKGFQNE